MEHAGLDISDDAIHCLSYARHNGSLAVDKHISIEVPPGLIDGGDVKDEKRLRELLAEVDRKVDLSYVKVSISEEKAYLFQTDVPDSDIRDIQQNIEFKLEENVPLSAPDAVFYFDLLPGSSTSGSLRASVTVVPRTYIERTMTLLNESGIAPVAFEIVPKAIAHAIMPPTESGTMLILHVMSKKTGIYVVSAGVVAFTSTIATGMQSQQDRQQYVEALRREINRVYAYWISRAGGAPAIRKIALVGKGAAEYEGLLQSAVSGAELGIEVADAWRNAFSIDRYVPPISEPDSLGYVVAAGLALPS